MKRMVLMNNSDSSSKDSVTEVIQLPLPGFQVQVTSDRDGWDKWVVTLENGVTQVKYVKIKK